MNKILNKASDNTLWNLLLSSSGINMIYYHENMKLMNRKKGFLVVGNLKIALRREAMAYTWVACLLDKKLWAEFFFEGEKAKFPVH